jgi:ATP-dependent Zn protease
VKAKAARRKVTNLERRAFHEAGHAIAHHVLGHGVLSVEIHQEDGDRGLGRAYPRSKPSGIGDRTRRGQRRMMGWVVTTMAGHVAEKLNHGRPEHRWKLTVDRHKCNVYVRSIALARLGRRMVGFEMDRSGEFGTARDFLREYGRCERQAARRTEHLLKRCWPMVRAVARALLAEQRLTGARLRRLITEATPGRVDVRALRAAATAEVQA